MLCCLSLDTHCKQPSPHWNSILFKFGGEDEEGEERGRRWYVQRRWSLSVKHLFCFRSSSVNARWLWGTERFVFVDGVSPSERQHSVRCPLLDILGNNILLWKSIVYVRRMFAEPLLTCRPDNLPLSSRPWLHLRCTKCHKMYLNLKLHCPGFVYSNSSIRMSEWGVIAASSHRSAGAQIALKYVTGVADKSRGYLSFSIRALKRKHHRRFRLYVQVTKRSWQPYWRSSHLGNNTPLYHWWKSSVEQAAAIYDSCWRAALSVGMQLLFNRHMARESGITLSLSTFHQQVLRKPASFCCSIWMEDNSYGNNIYCSCLMKAAPFWHLDSAN